MKNNWKYIIQQPCKKSPKNIVFGKRWPWFLWQQPLINWKTGKTIGLEEAYNCD